MSDRHQDLELPVPPEQARETVRRAVAELGWGLSEEGADLVVRERAGLLSDHWPLGIKVSIGAGPDGSTLSLWGRMGGFGPFIAERLKETMDEFVARLGPAEGSGAAGPALRG